MADNTRLNENTTTGDLLAMKEVTHGGDTAKLQTISLVGCSGSEGSYTIADINGCGTYGLDVDVTRSALPSGAATAANQSTANTALSAIQTAVQLIDNAISGSEMQVDVVAALPAGTNAIGKLAANDGVDIGDVTLNNTSIAVTASNDSSLNVTVGDGSNTATIRNLAANDALNVAIVDASGDQVTSFGGGTQYTEGATDATITGTAMLMEGAGDALVVAPGTAADGLLVNLGSNNDVTVTGTVTANAGTNLNTSALALESGGNLATIAGDTTSIDGKITACNTGAVVVSSGTITTVSSVTAIANALPAGDNNIGNVDIVTLPADTFVAEDGALGKGVLLQGDDGTDRTNVLVDTDGHVQVDVQSCASHAVTNAGTFAVQVDGDALTALQLIDDTVAVLGTATYSEATTKGSVVGAVRNDDLATLANTDNEIAPLQVNSAGALHAEASQQIDYAFDGSAKVTIARASGVATDGTTAIVAAQASKKVRIFALALFATSATATNIYLATTTDTDVLGNSGNPIPLAVDADGDNTAGFVLPWNPGGWTETSTANEALNLVLSAAQDVVWMITYAYVD